MKRHIIGFAIFSLIVGSAVFVKAIFNASEEVIVPVADNYSYTSVTKKSCWRMRQELAETEVPVVRQALLDLNDKSIDWELYVPKADTRVALHFFVKNSKGTRYIATELAPVVTSYSGSKWVTYTSSYISLSNFSPYENLYVVPEMISRSDAEMKIFNPVFDPNTATPVTVNSGKAVYTVR